MNPNKASRLFEVFFQDAPNMPITTDIVFSEDEAQGLVLSFYNQHREDILPDTPPFRDYQTLAEFKKNNPYWSSHAWYEVIEDVLPLESPPVRPPEMTDCPQRNSTPIDLNAVAAHLQHLLQYENIHLPTQRVEQLLNQAFEDSQNHPLPIEPTPQLANSQTETVWLIQVGEDDLAVYLDANYIDSASRHHGESMEDILSTAQMLSEKYQAKLEKHCFETLPHGWSWADVDNIMHRSGKFPHDKTPLLAALQKAKTIKMNDILVRSFEIFSEAYQAYLSHGSTHLDLLKLTVKKGEHVFEMYLTVEEIVKATQVKPNQWVCFDQGATELVIDHHLIEQSISSLLR